MSEDKNSSLGMAHDFSLLRQKAEKLQQPISAQDAENMPAHEVYKLIQELQIHQVELEMQNHQLQMTTQELAQAQEKYRDLYYRAPFGYVTLDEHGIIEEANAKGMEILASTQEQLTNRRFSQFIHPDHLDAFYGFFKKVLLSDKPQNTELSLLGPSQKALYVQLEGTLLRRENDTDQARLAFLDVTERKETYQALHNKEVLLSAIINSSLNAIQVFRAVRDTQGNLLDFEWLLLNRTAELFLDHTLEQLRLYRLSDLLPSFITHGHFLILTNVVEYGEPAKFTYHYQHQGQERWLNCVAVKLEDGVVLTFEDVTPQRVANDRLQESQLLLTKMAEAMPDFLYVEDLQQGRNVYNNRNFLAFLGYGPSDIKGHPRELLDTLYHPQDAPLLLNRSQRYKDVPDGEYLESMVRIMAKDGQYRHLLFRETVFKRGANGIPTQLVGVAQDITEKLKAEKELLQTNATIKDILNNLPVILWRIDQEGTILEARGSGLQMLGYQDQAPLTGKNIKDVSAAAATHLEKVRQGTPVDFVTESVVEGKPVFKHNFFFYEETTQQLVGFCLDITEQKLAQAEAQHSTMLLDQILYHIPMVLAVIDAEGNYLEMKGAGLRKLGLQDNELTGRSIYEIFPQLKDNIQDVLEGEVKSFTSSFQHQGQEVHFQNFGFLDRQRKQGIAFGLDITQLQQAQNQLTHEKEFTQRLLDTHIHGIIALDLHLNVTAWNNKMEEISGFSRHEVMDKPLIDVLPPKSQKRFAQKLQKVLLGEQITLLKMPYFSPGRKYEATITPVYNPPHKISGILGIIQDTTAREQRQKQDTQLKLDKQKDILDAILTTQNEERKRIAEALHNSLAQLLYAAKLNLEDLPPTTTAEKANDPVVKRISNFLDEAIKETRTLAHELIPRALEDLGLKSAIKDLASKVTTPSFTVQSIITGFDQPTNYSIETHLFRFVQELLNNVMKHANATEALVQVVDKGNQIMVRVQDNGVGMSPQDQLKTKGMGLATIRKRTKLLKGVMHIHSAPQEGTTVTITLKK